MSSSNASGISSSSDASPPSSLASSQAEKATSLCTAIYDYDAQHGDELTLRQGDLVEIISKDHDVTGDDGWWKSVFGANTHRCKIGKIGSQPSLSSLPLLICTAEL